jgi:hypothetical protein
VNKFLIWAGNDDLKQVILMRLIFVFFLSLLMAGGTFGQENWKAKGIKLPPIVCYASHESHQSFVHPPAEYLEKLKSGSLKKASIIVTYVNFPQNAKDAFQYAVDIWQDLIESTVPIHVTATWESLSSGVLGQTSPGDYYKNFNSTEMWNTYYPVAIVEKMLGEEVNGAGQPDINASFNKDFPNWYFGTDGKTPSNKYDFSSVVLHELAHGLGFIGRFYTNRGTGGYGDDGLPAVFDQSVENKNGDKLVNTALFANPSIKLYQNLTSKWLAFDTYLIQGSMPRLYAPTTWDSGSSVYHLDESTYPAGDANSLMTPFSGMGEAIHNPGNSALAIMFNMGWKTLSIRHTPLKDIEQATSPISFDATINSDYGLDSTKLFLVYSSNKFVKKDSVLLKATTIPEVFNAKLNLTKFGQIDYYFAASDIKQRRYVYPSGASARYLSFKIGPDKEAPVIVHDPVKYMMDSDLKAKISAQITDNLGVKNAKLEYYVSGGLLQSVDMKNDSADRYSGELSFPAGSLKDNDIVYYRIAAYDASSQNNIGRLPLSGYFRFRIAGFRNPVKIYVNDFSVDTLDFISGDFKIYTVSGFDSPALNSPHPYPSPDADKQEFNLTTTLKYPIILKPGGKMHFDEIALVEPGDAGVKFGSENFFDYVIVEGSSDQGNNWKPLADGYDCNLVKSWATLYNGAMTGQNSTAVPTKDLFVNHEIDLLANGNFKAGDTIQIRFRLFSDPYAHGWGWIIDNLKIQDVETAVNPQLLSPGEISYYPNPAKDKLNLQIQSKDNLHQFVVKAYNLSGSMVYCQSFATDSSDFSTEIDVTGFNPGLYLFSLEPTNGQVITRKIQIQ